MQENIINYINDSDNVPELMYQHVQFRRTEKFMKNYIDTGMLVNQKLVSNSNRVLQEIQFMDKSMFWGEVVMDEETRNVFREGLGHFQRPKENNYCYYNKIIGNWSRNILHGKRIEYLMNLSVFPIGYYASYQRQKGKPVDNLSIVQEMKKGIANGASTIMINNEKVCKTSFSD